MLWKVVFYYLSGTIITIYSGLYLIFETIQLLRRHKKYLMELENYVQVIMFILILIFVFPYGESSRCWHYSNWRWQVGTLGVFLAWVNSFMLLRDAPWVGQPITMLLNVYNNFIKIIYLPVLLIATFAVPFYMIFFSTNAFQVSMYLPSNILLITVQSSIQGDENTSTIVLTFANPFIAIWSVILQTFGGVDAGPLFDESEKGYEVLSYSLFTLFIIAMPVLFNNFLVRLKLARLCCYSTVLKQILYLLLDWYCSG